MIVVHSWSHVYVFYWHVHHWVFAVVLILCDVKCIQALQWTFVISCSSVCDFQSKSSCGLAKDDTVINFLMLFRAHVFNLSFWWASSLLFCFGLPPCMVNIDHQDNSISFFLCCWRHRYAWQGDLRCSSLCQTPQFCFSDGKFVQSAYAIYDRLYC